MGAAASTPDTALATAIQVGHLDLAREALKMGADINYCAKHSWPEFGFGFSRSCSTSSARTWSEETPVLLIAAARADGDMCRTLLDAGCDPNATQIRKDGAQLCALLAAVNAGSEVCVKLLLERGADVQSVPLLAAACCSGRVDCLRMLLRAGALPDFAEDGFMPLHYCCCRGQRPTIADQAVAQSAAGQRRTVRGAWAECARVLIDLGALTCQQINSCDQSGLVMPALSYAAHFGDVEVVRVLLASGASKEVQGAQGLTAAQYARNSGHEALAQELD